VNQQLKRLLVVLTYAAAVFHIKPKSRIEKNEPESPWISSKPFSKCLPISPPPAPGDYRLRITLVQEGIR
jgi:hypothetical protein